MSVFEEDKKRYVLVRIGQDEREDVASIDSYSGNLYWHDRADGATKFESIEEAKEFMNIQATMAKLLKKDWKFEVLEEHRVIGKIGG